MVPPITMLILIVAARLMVRALMPVPKCIHGVEWKACQICASST